MIKTRFTAELLNGKLVSRTSTSMLYTHAVVSESRSVSWHTNRELAERGMAQAVRWYKYQPSDLRVVKVTSEQLLPKRTSAADKNATRRGVISREIKRMNEYFIYAEAEVVRWEGGIAEQNKARLIEHFGEKEGLAMHERQYAEVRRRPAYAREQIAKLETERAALLAEKAEG